MTYNDFYFYAVLAFVLWLSGSISYYLRPKKIFCVLADIFVIAGLGVLIYFIASLWMSLGRPPLRTFGETRLWYSVLLPALGLIIRFKWKMPWFLVYSLFVASVFLAVNFFNPELFDKTLMPALQSPWFIPHVIVYIEAYALLAGATIFAVRGLVLLYRNRPDARIMLASDTTVHVGYAFLTFGLIFGALWAKKAWGHYWTWDPKETWALLTWLSYLIYIHIRHSYTQNTKLALWFLPLNFIILLLCWFGVNYLPAASESIHAYMD